LQPFPDLLELASGLTEVFRDISGAVFYRLDGLLNSSHEKAFKADLSNCRKYNLC